MSQSDIVKRIEEICKEFDARVIEVGLPIARLELAKALAEIEAAQHRLQRTDLPASPEITNAIAENTGPSRRGVYRRR